MKASKAGLRRGIIVAGSMLFLLLCCVIYSAKQPIFMPSGAKLPSVFYNTPRTSLDEQKNIYPHVFFPKEDGTPIHGSSQPLSENSIRFVFQAKSDGLQKIEFFTLGGNRGSSTKISASLYKYDAPAAWPGDATPMNLIHTSSILAPASGGLQKHAFEFPRQDSSYGGFFAVDISSPDKTSVEICTKKTTGKNQASYMNGRAVTGSVYFWDEYGRKRFSLGSRPVLLGSPEFIVQHAFSKLTPLVKFITDLPGILSENSSRILFILLLMAGSLAAPFLIWRFALRPAAAPKKAPRISKSVKILFFCLERVLFLMPFLAIVCWFSTHDIWNTNIAHKNSVYAFHTIFRGVFIFYFFWIIYFAGLRLVRLFEERWGMLPLSYLDRLIVVFFTGAAGWHIMMLVLGYMNAYYRWTAYLLSIPLLFLSYTDLRAFGREGWGRIANVIAQSDRHDRRTYYLLGSGIIFFSAILFLVIGLYTNDGDYITHYGNFYDDVIRNHGIWPNGWWYQYFYSKGAGLLFFSMLLTDKMSPPIVSYIFIMASCLIMSSLIRRLSKGFLGAMTAVFYFLGVLIANYTIPYRMHVPSGVMLIALVWMMSLADNNQTGTSKVWRVAGSMLFGSLIILAPTVAVYAFAALGIYLIGALILRRWGLARLYGAWLLAGGVFLAAIMGMNFLTTGLFEGTPFRLWLGFWDQTRSSAWVSPYMLFYVSELIGPDMGRVIMPGQFSTSICMTQLLSEALRFNYISPLFLKWFSLPGIIILIFLAIKKRSDLSTCVKVVLLPASVVLALVVLSLLSINQTTSLIRSVGFSGFYLALCVFSLWSLVLRHYGRRTFNLFVLGVVFVAFSLTLKPIATLRNRIDYISGRKSMWDAMAAEGNIYRPIADMRKEIGIDKQVAYLQINGKLGQAYLIGRGLLNPISYSYWDKWPVLAFEEPEKAVDAFKKMGINYFLIDFSSRAYDLIAYSPLFSGENMKKYFCVRWSSEPFYLLTWRGDPNAFSDITDDFLKRWSEEQKRPDHFGLRAYERLKFIYQFNHGKTSGVKVPPDLPPLEKSIEKGLLIYKKGN